MSNDNQGSRDTRAIESALKNNRTHIENTLDKLRYKFSPGEIFDQAWRYARKKSEDGSTSRLKDVVVRNPLPVALIGTGFAWLMISGRNGSVPPRKNATASSSANTDRLQTGATPPVSESQQKSRSTTAPTHPPPPSSPARSSSPPPWPAATETGGHSPTDPSAKTRTRAGQTRSPSDHGTGGPA